jgi:3'(2'), 5'-bisphosphate nucleotidase
MPILDLPKLSLASVDSLVQQLLVIVAHAGEAIEQCGNLAVNFKSDASPVTAADLASHQILAGALPQVLALPVISEESQVQTQAWSSGQFWLVDPLDGTKEFIAGNGEYVVCVALMDAGRPLLGCIYQPQTQLSYWGGAGFGSFRVQPDGTQSPITTQRANFDEPLIALVSRQGAEAEAQWIEQLSRHWPSGVLQKPMGSALKACAMAMGQGDFYPRRGRTCIWDTAAAQAILQGAGGDFYSLDGRVLTYPAQQIYNPEFIAVADKTLPWLELLGIH